MLLLSNIFSFNMLKELPSNIVVDELTLEQAKALIPNAQSIIRRRVVAVLLSSLVDSPIEVCTQPFYLGIGDQLLVGLFKGSRIPNDATELPAGAFVQWMLISVKE